MTYTCPKCEGHGKIAAFGHVQAGVCFKCNGAGTVASKPAAKSQKWTCIYNGVEFFVKSAKTEAQALKIAVTHWKLHSNYPAFANVKSEADITVKLD